MRWEGARAGARVPCGGLAGWASGASAHGRCRWVVRTGHTPACGGTLLRGLPAPAIPVCPARPSCLGSPGPRHGPSGPQGSVSHAGVPASGATTQPSRSQSSRLGPVTPGLRCCPAACRPPHSGSSALLVRTRAPDPGTARAQGSLSLTRQLAGAAPPEASLGDTKGGPHARACHAATHAPFSRQEVQGKAQREEAPGGGEEGVPGAGARAVPDRRVRVQGAGGAAARDRPQRVAGQQQCVAGRGAGQGPGAREQRCRECGREAGSAVAVGRPRLVQGPAAVTPPAVRARAQGHTRSPALGAESHRALVL